MRPALEHPNVTLLTNAEAVALAHQPGRHRRDRGRRSSARASARPSRGRHRRRLVRSGQLGQAAARLGQRQAPERPRPTAPTSSGATTPSTTARPCWRSPRKRTRRSSRRRSGSTTSTSAATTSSTRSATSRWSASRRRRCTAARSRSRPSSRRTRTLESMARHAVDFWLSTEDLPRPENRVTLDRDGRVTAELHADQRGARRSASTTSSSRCSAHCGMHPDHLIPRHAYLKTDIPVAGVAHQAGTCRFGTDPATSVLNTDCRAHELDNLYVVDTSFFPSIGAVNPALTAMANALRVGDHLLERLGADGERRPVPPDAAGERTPPRRDRRRRLRRAGGRAQAAARRRRRDARRPQEPPPVPAAALPGGGGRAVPERLRLADPPRAQAQLQHHAC